MKKINIIVCFVMTAAIAIALCGCSGQINSSKSVKTDNSYSVGDASIREKVESIEIDWTSGDIVFATHDQNTVDIAEKIDGEVEEKQRMHWKLDGTTLVIKYNEPSFTLLSLGSHKKHLTVTLPKDLSLAELDIDATSADITVPEIQAGKCNVDFTSGTLDINCLSNKVDINATSGTIKAQCEAQNIRIDATSARISLAQKGAADSIVMDMTSGNIEAVLERFNDLDISGTSGDITLTLPKEAGFTATVDATSGEFESDFPVKTSKGRYTAGDGSSRINIDVTSGDVKILMAE